MNAINSLIAETERIANLARFASVVYTSKESGEVARHTLILCANYIRTLEASKLALELLDTRDIARSMALPVVVCDLAKAELLASIAQSIESQSKGEQHPDYTKRGMYRTIAPGIQVFVDNTLELKGLTHAKVVLTPGTHRVVKSSAKTMAKNAMRRELPLGKFRTLCLDLGNMHAVKLNGETICFE